MLGEEDKNRLSGTISNRRTYLRSVSWSDRSPSNPNPRQQQQQHQSNSKTRACLPPLLPLSISKRSVEEWPRAGSDDLGVWPQPPTPGARTGSSKKLENSDSERVFEFKKDKLAFFEKECSRISDHIYLGSDAVAKNREILRQNRITHVLNCVGFVCPEYFKGDLVYKTLWLQDSPSEDITSILYDVFDYFEDVREQGGRVFVHCCQGVSRSTSLVIAYLMWREGQSFEDAFQYVKAARGVTNPNMGFACQLLQCQKRVHAVPASPNSVLRMYRMAPHSPYDPLHLVPKLLNHPSVQGLDSRGGFIVHVPTAMYVWIGKNCNMVMSSTARTAASQVIRYERAQGPIVNVKEGEEPPEFWDALASGQFLEDGDEKEAKEEGISSAGNNKVAAAVGIGERKVDVYDLDFEIFHKALAGGVVPPFPLSGTGSETCLPARESGWGRLRRRLAEGIMKEFVTSSKLNCGTTQSDCASDMKIDASNDEERLVSPSDFSSPSTSPPCGSPDSFSCFPKSSPDRKIDINMEHSTPLIDSSLLPLPSPCGSPDSFSYFLCKSPKPNYKSPSLSPSNSDYSSSFTFSPSSSNWSDFSYVSSRQPSPSSLESKDPSTEKSCFHCKETIPSLSEAFSANNASRVANTCSPCRGIFPSIAERRGSNPPPLMLLTSVDKPPQVPRTLVRSWSFSLPDLDDEMMEDADCNQFKGDCNKEEPMLEADVSYSHNKLPCEMEDNKFFSLPSNDKTEELANVTGPILYQWPTMNKVGMHCLGILDSRSVYLMFTPKGSLAANNPNTLYIWLGHGTSNEQLQSEGIISADTHNKNHFDWETIGRNFLNQMGLPIDAMVQIVKQGDEPEQFLNHLI